MIRIFLFIFCYFITIQTTQAQLDFGKVRQQKKFCKQKGAHACNCDEFIEGPLCLSKYQLDIRIIYPDTNNVNQSYILRCDSSGKWSAFIRTDTIRMNALINRREIMQSKYIPLVADIGFDTLFTQLKENKIFRLNDLVYLSGGGIVSLYYKAGNKFNRYVFSNPESMLKIRTGAGKYVKYYYNIMDLFINHLKPLVE